MGNGLPDECSANRISRSRNPISMDDSLKGHILDKEDYAKYLGVELQSKKKKRQRSGIDTIKYLT